MPLSVTMPQCFSQVHPPPFVKSWIRPCQVPSLPWTNPELEVISAGNLLDTRTHTCMWNTDNAKARANARTNVSHSVNQMLFSQALRGDYLFPDCPGIFYLYAHLSLNKIIYLKRTNNLQSSQVFHWWPQRTLLSLADWTLIMHFCMVSPSTC